jgi:hypothetical protein
VPKEYLIIPKAYISEKPGSGIFSCGWMSSTGLIPIDQRVSVKGGGDKEANPSALLS